MPKKSSLPLIASGSLTAVILAVMDLFLLPAVESAANGLRCFDLQIFGYDYETAKTFLDALSEEGRRLYLYAQIPTDTVFLAVYTVFFILALRRLYASGAIAILPLLLALADFAENACTFLMLRDPACLTPVTGTVFGALTLCKSLLMYAVFALLAVGLVRFLVQKRKSAAKEAE